MTASEFDNGFDVLYNNISSNAAPSLDTYEKSFFLSKAQYEIVKNHFLDKESGYGSNPKRDTDFSYLITTVKRAPLSDTEIEEAEEHDAFFSNTTKFKQSSITNSDVLLVLNEFVEYTKDNITTRVPVTTIGRNEFDRLMSKPFKYPSKGQCWKINTHIATFEVTSDNNSSREVDTLIEVLLPYNIKNTVELGEGNLHYILRYVRTPKPIILGNLNGMTNDPTPVPIATPLTIDGEYAETKYDWGEGQYKDQACELHPELHEEILQRAVELAKIAYIGDPKDTIQTGTRSE